LIDFLFGFRKNLVIVLELSKKRIHFNQIFFLSSTLSITAFLP
jgi:hypothetical protein